MGERQERSETSTVCMLEVTDRTHLSAAFLIFTHMQEICVLTELSQCNLVGQHVSTESLERREGQRDSGAKTSQGTLHKTNTHT